MKYNIITCDLTKEESNKLYEYLIKLQKGFIPDKFAGVGMKSELNCWNCDKTITILNKNIDYINNEVRCNHCNYCNSLKIECD